MIYQYSLGQEQLVLSSDLAGECPIYIYISVSKETLLYSTSISALLDDSRVNKPLKVSLEGLSFLLQSGVVPPPKTAYENIFILGVGDRCEVNTESSTIKANFSHKFPFMNAQRLQPDAMQPDENLILQMLAEATVSRLDVSRPSFLFHSAGKDSNSIALALAEAGWQDQVTLISHKSKGAADESEISAKIAKQLGFRHQVLREVDNLQEAHKKAIGEYFIHAPFPSTDNVTLAYPIYAHQLPELKGANIIDGMGNDVFMGHIPSRKEFQRQKVSRYLKHTRFLTKHAPSESFFHTAGKTRSECTGFFGLSYSDTKKILPSARDSSTYWLSKDTNEDYLDFRASIRGIVIDQEIFTRKIRNFSDSIRSNSILPWTNQKVAKYFAEMPEAYLFDRPNLKNKLILRKILKERIGLDSDALGKLGFTYDSHTVVSRNWDALNSEITNCKLWEKVGLESVMGRLTKKISKGGRDCFKAMDLLYRLYLISSWYNQNKYLARATN